MDTNSEQRHLVTLEGGRSLEFAEAGPGDGRVVVYHHGTPGSSFLPPGNVQAATSRGIRLIAPSRAGYGSSDRDADRDVAAVATDTLQLCDALGIERFATIGWSGGGPHALACAVLAAPRCVAAISLAGVAPYLPDELDWTKGMAESNVKEFELGLAGGPAYEEGLVATAELMLAVDPEVVTSASDLFGDLVGDADVKSTSTEDVRFLIANMHHALANGVGGWRDDDQALLHPWGFDVAAAAVPVAVWYGDQDLMVPSVHGDWLAANVAGARSRRLEGDGHLTVGLGRFAEALDELATLAGPSW